ncbi:hypothetical protein RV00_GL001724 [Enterococcus devriesei]|uniref:Uncharacterized protein n=1 Tax=Enterococcus devriesei TaxID=319970 RepID=A0A1L8SWF4_9ENTE|nr:hypothetical protein RV00_GL001724 [Enterococcus devriesei]
MMKLIVDFKTSDGKAHRWQYRQPQTTLKKTELIQLFERLKLLQLFQIDLLSIEHASYQEVLETPLFTPHHTHGFASVQSFLNRGGTIHERTTFYPSTAVWLEKINAGKTYRHVLQQLRRQRCHHSISDDAPDPKALR